MGKITGFLEFDRQEQKYQLAADRVRHFREFTLPLDEHDLKKQAARCMDCGIPFCHGPTGCPVHNQIPDWNELVFQSDWEEAARNLHSTNNFPEFTGRVCPAPCEEACTLNLENQPVAIKTIEQAIADRAWNNGWVKPEIPASRTGKKVAVIGSGPAGMAAAQQLARVGHDVHVFEREPKAGGLLRYGIPDFKMEKRHIDRRVKQMEAEGVTFHYGVNVGVTKPLDELTEEHDAVVYCRRRRKNRAMPQLFRAVSSLVYTTRCRFLCSQNKQGGAPKTSIRPAGNVELPVLASGKHIVVVIGGGDTASDCVGTAFRQGAVKVTQLDIRPQSARSAKTRWLGVAFLGDQNAHFVFARLKAPSSRVPGRNAANSSVTRWCKLTGVVKCCQRRRKAQSCRRHVNSSCKAELVPSLQSVSAGSVRKRRAARNLGDRLEIGVDGRGSTYVKANETRLQNI